MSYLQNSGRERATVAQQTSYNRSERPIQPGLGAIDLAGIAANPVSGITSLLFGGTAHHDARVVAYKAMLQVWYNEAANDGDVNAARALLYYANGGTPYPSDMAPPAKAYLMQLQSTAPQCYAAAVSAGPWPNSGKDIQTANVPRNPNPSLAASKSSGNSLTGALSSVTGGNMGGLMLPALAIGAIFLLKKR